MVTRLEGYRDLLHFAMWIWLIIISMFTYRQHYDCDKTYRQQIFPTILTTLLTVDVCEQRQSAGDVASTYAELK